MSPRRAVRWYLVAWLDVSVPTPRDLTWVLGGFVAMLAVGLGLPVAFDALEAAVQTRADPASHAVAESMRAQQRDGGLTTRQVASVLASVLFAAVIEEFAVRNHAQKLAAAGIGWPAAILVVSAVFAALHVPAYGGLPVTLSIAQSILFIFGLSIVLGTVYWATRNVVAAMLLHGLWNAFVVAVVVTG